MPFVKFAVIAAIGLVFIGCGTAGAAPSHAIALHGSPLFADNFRAFPYVNPSAPKGGRLTLGVLGSFENLNPLIVQGVPAAGIREFVVESLMARSLDEPFTLYGLLAETIDVADDRQVRHVHAQSGRKILRPPAGHARRRHNVIRASEDERPAEPSHLFREGHESREDRRARRTVHVRGCERSRTPADPRPDAGFRRARDDAGKIRNVVDDAARWVRALYGFARRCRPLDFIRSR